jgi:hypothetical protein
MPGGQFVPTYSGWRHAGSVLVEHRLPGGRVDDAVEPGLELGQGGLVDAVLRFWGQRAEGAYPESCV